MNVGVSDLSAYFLEAQCSAFNERRLNCGSLTAESHLG